MLELHPQMWSSEELLTPVLTYLSSSGLDIKHTS